MGARSNIPENGLESVTVGPTLLHGVAVRAQRDHLYGVVTATFGNALDVVHFQNGTSVISEVVWLSAACRVLAMALAAQEDGLARFFQAYGVLAGGVATLAVSGGFALFDLADQTLVLGAVR
ncbi:hypothetical protein JOF35_000830 [Streptomyces demainii]|uniref:Uncharacterized protein n=1 Tax=Streptomyces demainii TaxID=588122 RepID=A0ABT9KJF4_9ACTN|nr:MULTISPECIES: hypothetical protein [Streptomyces]MDP9608553.1 hypothetical protein [Streptomyces demainii]